MPRVSIGDLNLTVTSRTNNAERNLRIMQEFLKTIPVIMQEFADRSAASIKTIAPEQKHKFIDKSGKRKSKNLRTGQSIKNSIRVSEYSGDGFTVSAGGTGRSGVKAVMQEFGYPYDNWYGPYEPNPRAKYPKFRGLGYIRVGLIVAARSLMNESINYTDDVNYNISVSKSNIKNYERDISRSVNTTIQKFALRFARGDLKKLPKYYSNKVKIPTETVSQNVSRFGSFRGLQIKIPLSVYIGDRYSNGLQFKGVTTSKSGLSQVSPSYSFLI